MRSTAAGIAAVLSGCASTGIDLGNAPMQHGARHAALAVALARYLRR